MVGEFGRYIIAGIVNTVLGYLVFLLFFRLVGSSAVVSNAIGYAVGLLSAYLMNFLYVFNKKHSFKSAIRFFIGFLFSYLINSIVLILLIEFLNFRAEFAQIFAMSVYTASFYLINKYFVWLK